MESIISNHISNKENLVFCSQLHEQGDIQEWTVVGTMAAMCCIISFFCYFHVRNKLFV